MSKNKAGSRKRQEREFDVECVDRLTWKNWEVGSTYTQKLTIKNISRAAQNFSFSMPQHKTIFLTPFPESVLLHAGMSYSIEVTFVPQEYREVHDALEVHVHDRGSFVVFLDVLTPFASVDIISAHDFGYCGVNIAANTSITMTNSGTVSLPYVWEVTPPFTVTPIRGVLEESHAVELMLTFTPQRAEMISTHAVCKMEGTNEIVATVKLTGVGKYAHVYLEEEEESSEIIKVMRLKRKGALSDDVKCAVRTTTNTNTNACQMPKLISTECNITHIKFGNVDAGCSQSYSIYVKNPSPVAAHVSISLDDPEHTCITCPFSFQPSEFVVMPNERQCVKVTFVSFSTCAVFCQNFRLDVVGGNSFTLTLSAHVVSSDITISTNALYFDEVNLDKPQISSTLKCEVPERSSPQSQFVTLYNNSSHTVDFEFAETSDTNGFAIEPNKGKLKLLSSTKLRVTFCPTCPINYARRLFLLCSNASRVIFIDVFGSAYNHTNRPLRFTNQYVSKVHSRELTIKKPYIDNCNDNGKNNVIQTIANGEGVDINNSTGDNNKKKNNEIDTNNLLQCGKYSSTERIKQIRGMRNTDKDCDYEDQNDISTNNKQQEQMKTNAVMYYKYHSESLHNMETSNARKLVKRMDFVRQPPHEQKQEQLSMVSELPLNTLFSSHAGSSPFYLSPSTVSFMRRDNSQQVELVTVYNKSNEPAWVSWHVSTANVFTVSPMEREVQANSFVQFEVSNANYCNKSCKEYLECFVNYAVMRSFRTVPEGGLVLPWCLTLQCRQLVITRMITSSLNHANSEVVDHNNMSSHVSLISISPSVAYFPETSPCHISYQTVTLTNITDSPVLYDILSINLTEVESLVDDHNVVRVSLCHDEIPHREQEHTECTAIRKFTNQTEAPPQQICTELIEQHKTCPEFVPLETISKSSHITSSLMESAEIEEVFTCYPTSGLLLPHERQSVVFKFAPTTLRCAQYAAEVHIRVMGSGVETRTSLRLLARCITPRLLLSPRSVIFPPTCVYNCSTRELHLYNPTTQTIEYELVATSTHVVSFSSSSSVGQIEPNTDVCITVVFTPEHAQPYDGQLELFFAQVQSECCSTRLQLPSLPHYTDNWEQEQQEQYNTENNGNERALYSMSIPYRGKGCIPQIEISPNLMNLGELTCAHEHYYTFTIYNSSLCALSYEVKILPHVVVNAATSNKSMCTVQSHFPELRHQRGVVYGRSHATVQMSVLPSPGMSNYILYVVTKANETRLSNDGNEVNTNAEEDEKTYVCTPQTELPAITLDDVQNNYPYSMVTFIGMEPVIRVIDAYSPQCNRVWIWEQFSLHRLNTYLANRSPSCPSTYNVNTFKRLECKEQMKFMVNETDAAAKTREQSNFEYNAEHSPVVGVDLGVGKIGSPSFAASILFENNGDYPVQLHFQLPTEHPVGWERWYTQDELLADIYDLVEAGLITISPRSPRIEAHNTAVVSFRYNFAIIGVHTLPVLLQADIIGPSNQQGSESSKIQVMLVLEGRTIPSSASDNNNTTFNTISLADGSMRATNEIMNESNRNTALNLHHSSLFDLIPVMLGDMQPPLQGIWLDNTLNTDVTYAVDVEELDAVARDNYNFPILTCVNPAGVIAADECAQLLFYFRPLEAKEYSLPITIYTYHGEQYKITLTGKGVHPSEYTKEMLHVAEQKLSKELYLSCHPRHELRVHMPVILSDDIIHFDTMPFHHSATHVCALTNRSANVTFMFKFCTTWNITTSTALYGDHAIVIEPDHGMIEPLSTILVRFNLESGSTCQMLQKQIECFIFSSVENDDKLDDYGEHIDAKTLRHVENVRPETLSRRDLENYMVTSPLTTASQFKLWQRYDSDVKEDEKEQQRLQYMMCVDVLHILIQAHIVPVEEYETYFTTSMHESKSQIAKMHQAPLLTYHSPVNDINVTDDEQKLLRCIFEQLIKEVINLRSITHTFATPRSHETISWEELRANITSCFKDDVKHVTRQTKSDELQSAINQHDSEEVTKLSPNVLYNEAKNIFSDLILSAMTSVFTRQGAEMEVS